MMYYFVFKQVGCLVYSYCLLIIYFWVLIFLYIWVGFYYFYYIVLFDWVLMFGMVFLIILWMLSWGGMINGLMILQGVWDKLCIDLIICMFVMSFVFYGMFIFEGLMMLICVVNVLSYYIDWIIGYVYFGVLGWNGLIVFGVIYFLMLWLWGLKEMYLMWVINWYFWLVILGIVFYVLLMWVIGIMEGLMWCEVDDQGFLVNSFVDIVSVKFLMYIVCGMGGVLYLSGVLLMCWNMYCIICGVWFYEQLLI